MQSAADGRLPAIRAALREVGNLSESLRGRPFHLGICRTFTVEPQVDAIRLALASLPSRPTITLGDLENIEQVLLDPASPMQQAKPDAILVLWRLEELHPRLVYHYEEMSAEERAAAADDVIARIDRLCRSYSDTATAPLLLSTLPELAGSGAAARDVHSAHGPRQALLRINQALLEWAARSAKIHLFDFAGWAASEGASAFDRKMDLYARQPIAADRLMSFARALADGLRPLLYPAAKVLAVDLDNVLWGGVLGEDGLDGLKIGHDFPGNVYRRIQQHCRSLQHRGVLLALLSKNNLEDVEQAFSTLPEMPLRLSDFAAVRVNWLEKQDNLRSIAEELNLGLDSFVFVDDQAFEREQMRFHLPEVAVLAASEDPLQTLDALTAFRGFDSFHVSDEDRRRTAEYAAQKQRRELETAGEGGEGFLHTLNLRARIARVSEATVPRVVQMLNKTSQFNVTTRRHSEADVRRMMSDPANALLVLSLADRFGDQGIVGLAIAIADHSSGAVRIDSFLLSCRAIGRGAEDALWASILANVSGNGRAVLEAEYLKSPKNRQVAELFTRLGMATLPDATEERTQFRLALPAQHAAPAWIDIIDETLTT